MQRMLFPAALEVGKAIAFPMIWTYPLSPITGHSSGKQTNTVKGDIVVIYDGECGFCNRSVLFILKRDKEQRLQFSANKSSYSRSQLSRSGINAERPDTLVLIENGEAHTYSDAALRVAKYLKFPWNLFYYLIVIPRKARDPLYRFIARNRHRISGNSIACRIPDGLSKSRFIED